MLLLVFQLGRDRYALEAAQVAEVLPLLDLKQIPQAPAGIAGVFNYRGTPVPVIDLSLLTLRQAARRRLNTRIILVHYPDDTGESRLLGLIAEKATETLTREGDDFETTGVTNEAAPYLGPVTPDARGIVQRIEIQQLLPASIRDLLFKQPLET